MLVIGRKDLASNLFAYGEAQAAADIDSLPEGALKRIGEIGFRHALDGKHFLLAGCLAAIEAIEGKPRALKRKRRDWSAVPAELRKPDPRIEEIDAWVESYSTGEAVKKAEVIGAVSAALQKALPTFRFLKTHAQFRRPFDGGTAFIGLERGHGILYLRFGLAIDRVERTRASLYGSPSARAIPYVRTISAYSANIGPHSKHWPCEVRPAWPILGSEGIAKACPEIVSFTLDVVLPYLEEHEDPLNVRRTLLTLPGKALEHSPARTLFTIDHMLREREWLESDFNVLRERAKSHVPSLQEQLVKDYELVTTHWDETL